mmetsp:Transcript_39104/g.70028  ORF Transcript_39104/g.70028 Transcript_39104/m.70028 type:complete len:233 (-) Transcript_39104:123-821(-)|eukprot:CAMPEP_0177771690 /NCGR_PEP_ID=MMETSP0491_2-20121128/11755_1 /TAXON_ID=63592 /ORGANISM="Tetraselmis chuii, Strain PLY429" /LENGTH=232 /DNA_ID=CAMNT_0019289313 /DNA_START=158 /DNA_END=856 /DNA_ORIENTATION=+
MSTSRLLRAVTASLARYPPLPTQAVALGQTGGVLTDRTSPAVSGAANDLSRQVAQQQRGFASGAQQSTGGSAAAGGSKSPWELKAETLGLKYERGQAQAPWTPTKELFKRKTYFKRMAYLVQILEEEEAAERLQQKSIPLKFRSGDVLQITLVMPENRRRETVIKGLCIARTNAGLRSSFTIRNAFGNEAFERRFPLYSPNIKKIEVLESRPVRRSKLYYMRDRAPKEFRIG